MSCVAQGYVDYDPALRLEGVILNRVGSDAHTQWLREAVEASGVATRVLGGIPQARRHRASSPSTGRESS